MIATTVVETEKTPAGEAELFDVPPPDAERAAGIEDRVIQLLAAQRAAEETQV